MRTICSPITRLSSSGMSLLDIERTHSRRSPFPIRHGRNLIKGNSRPSRFIITIPLCTARRLIPLSHYVPHNTVQQIHRLCRCCHYGTLASSITASTTPPVTGSSKGTENPNRVSGTDNTNQSSSQAPLAAQVSARCAVTPSSNSALFRIVSDLLLKPWTPY